MFEIVHQRRDNSRWAWHYDTSDQSNADSDDRGRNIGENGLTNGSPVDPNQQDWLSNDEGPDDGLDLVPLPSKPQAPMATWSLTIYLHKITKDKKP